MKLYLKNTKKNQSKFDFVIYFLILTLPKIYISVIRKYTIWLEEYIFDPIFCRNWINLFSWFRLLSKLDKWVANCPEVEGEEMGQMGKNLA